VIGAGTGQPSPAQRRAMRRIGPARQLGLVALVLAGLLALFIALTDRGESQVDPSGAADPGAPSVTKPE